MGSEGGGDVPAETGLQPLGLSDEIYTLAFLKSFKGIWVSHLTSCHFALLDSQQREPSTSGSYGSWGFENESWSHRAMSECQPGSNNQTITSFSLTSGSCFWGKEGA